MLHPQLRIEQVSPPYEQFLPPGALVTLVSLPFAIGRGFTNQLRIEHPDVSRRHACLLLLDDYYAVEDLASRNGTLVNGVRLAEHERRRLQNGDTLQIASALRMLFIDPFFTQQNSDVRPMGMRGLWLDSSLQTVLIDSEQISLPLQQFQLLALLFGRAGNVVTREEIAQALWSTDVALTEQMIDNTVSRLRANLQNYSVDHDYILTVRGRGYRFVQRP